MGESSPNMARPRSASDLQINEAWVRLWTALGQRPSGREFARRLGVSERTAWRYINKRLVHFAEVQVRVVKCKTCNGRGFLVGGQA